VHYVLLIIPAFPVILFPLAWCTALSVTETLDNRGSDCAADFIKLLEIMDTLSVGETLRILSTDPASQRDLHEWREFHYLIRKEDAQ
jgi:TusA-related sulfurtransferase